MATTDLKLDEPGTLGRGTPGCEMRAFHDLFSRLTGIQTKEHYCPVGPLHPIDQWEIKQAWTIRN